MKFTDGYWLNKEQYKIENPKEVYEAEIIKSKNGNDEVHAFASYKKINTRGDFLNIGNTSIRLFSPAEDIIGVRLTHFEKDEKNPEYKLQYSKILNPEARLSDDRVTLTSKNLTAELSLHDSFRLSFHFKNQKSEIKELTASELNAQASIDDLSTGSLHPLSVVGVQGNILEVQQSGIKLQRPVHYMREMLNIDVDTKIYGTGERFTPFMKNGQTVDILNKDSGTGSEQAYKNIP
ncbi:MAG: alpha-xylosidase, partial [Lactovum sp.]